MKFISFEEHKKELLKDPKFKKAYDALEPEYAIARALIEARIKRGWTQAEVARRLHTKQSVISRVEGARTTPSVSFLKRLASAFGSRLSISFR